MTPATIQRPRGFYPEINYDSIPEKFRRFRKLCIPAKKVLLLDYVRETLRTTSRRDSLMRSKLNRFSGDFAQIGFICVARAGSHNFKHLVWYLRSHDRPLDPNGPYGLPPEKQNDPAYRRIGPIEAVEPARVLEFFPEYLGWSI